MLLSTLALKQRLLRKALDTLPPSSRLRAGRDHHAHRPPRPCGITVHTGVGCSFGCVYCYIYDMGFPAKPRPYPLSPPEMRAALLLNPHFAPGAWGTPIALGSVTEPFLRETVATTIGYLEAFSTLGNPVQFSTKAAFGEDLAKAVARAHGRVSALVSISTLDRRLEPGAPDPWGRMGTIAALASRGVHTTLFFRPVIPGTPEEDAEAILEEARRRGAVGVVFGSLRVTERTLRALDKLGYGREVRRRLASTPRGGRQVSVKTGDIKKRLARMAAEKGLRVFPTACAASVEASGTFCNACSLGPCGAGSPPRATAEEVVELGKRLGARVVHADVGEAEVVVDARGSGRRVLLNWLKWVLRRRVVAVRRYKHVG